MFGKNFQRKYALTDQGVKNTKKGAFWTVIVNLVVMGGMGILYLLMYGLMGTLTDGAPLPGPALFLGLVIAFVILSFVTHLQQYHATYGLVYNEVKSTRLSLAERLRKLPLGYFGKRDLADLTETLMGDVNRMEHVWSHVLGYLYGAYISTAIIAVCLLVYDWRLTIACLWGGAGGLRPAVRHPEDLRPGLGADETGRNPRLRRHPGGVGKCPGDPRHQPGGALSGRAQPEDRRP